MGDRPGSIVYVHEDCSLFPLASHECIVLEDIADNKFLQMIPQTLSSFNKDTQESVASILANRFDADKGLSRSLGRLDITGALCSLVTNGIEHVVIQSAQALAALFLSLEKNKHMTFTTKDAIMSLINIAKSSDRYAK